MSAGEMVMAGEFLDRAASLLDGRTLQNSYYHYVAGLQAFLNEKTADAQTHISTSLDHTIEGDMPFAEVLNHIAMTWVLHDKRETKAAAPHLVSARRFCRETKNIFIDYLCLLVEAQAALIQGNEDRGIERLRQAFSIGREQGYLSHPWWVDKIMIRLCTKALKWRMCNG